MSVMKLRAFAYVSVAKSEILGKEVGPAENSSYNIRDLLI
jgi:hypothetical protein